MIAVFCDCAPFLLQRAGLSFQSGACLYYSRIHQARHTDKISAVVRHLDIPQERGVHHGMLSVALPDLLHRGFDFVQLVFLLLVEKEVHLLRNLLRDQADCPDRHRPDRPEPAVPFMEKHPGRVRNLFRAARRGFKLRV